MLPRAGHGSQHLGLGDAVAAGILRSRLSTTRPVPFAPTMLDAELLAAADAAVATRTPIAFVLPFPAPAAPVLLAAAAIVGSVVAHRGLDVNVAVAARNLTGVTGYDRLYLREEQLSRFVSRARVTAAGTIRELRDGARASGRLYVTGEVARLAGLVPRLDALVVDSSAVSAADISTLLAAAADTAIVYLTSSPLDPHLVGLREGGALIWGWDTASAAALFAPAPHSPPRGDKSAGPITVPVHLLTMAAETTVTVSAPPSGGILDTALLDLWRALGSLLGTHGVTSAAIGAGNAAAWAWSMFHVAATLPIAADRYDEHVRINPYRLPSRLTDAPKVAAEYARTVPAGPVRNAWRQVATAFTDVVRATAAQEKFPALVDWVAMHAGAGTPAAVVLRNPAMAAAVTAALAESADTPDLWDETVEVVTHRDLSALAMRLIDAEPAPLRHLCLTGGLPRSGAALLAAPPGPSLTILVGGPTEAARITRTALAARRGLNEIRWETVHLTAGLLGVHPAAPYEPTDPSIGLLSDTLAAAGEGADDVEVWEPFTVELQAVLADIVSTPEIDPSPPVRLDDSGLATTHVDALAVHLTAETAPTEPGAPVPPADNVVLLVAANDLVARRRGQRVDRVASKGLAADDVILLVDQQARQDLLTTVIEKLSESTTYATLARLVGFWHDRAALVHDSGRTYGSILANMDGTVITSETTIGTWVRADVDGPLDKADVGRFAAAVDDTLLAAEAERVGWALAFLHRVHRKVGYWLSAQVSGALTADTDATVDAALDIHVADLLDAVSSWVVTAVDPLRRRVPVTVLGTLVPAAVAAALPAADTPATGSSEVADQA